MEVHHHGHVHHQKKWKDYLFQFLMLFIAVFCGFLAEYQLEHYIEKERAKELGKTLYEELKSDSTNLQLIKSHREDKAKHFRYIFQYVRDSDLVRLPREFYPHFVWSFFVVSYIAFEPKDGMLEQLKNSGSLRYFRDIKLQQAIGDFSVAVNNLRTRLERESTLTATLNRDFVLKYMDMEWIDRITEKGALSASEGLKKYNSENLFFPAEIKNLSSFDKHAVSNLVMYNLQVISGTLKNQMNVYEEASSRLMSILRKKYHL
jgi:hypothetical protein